LQVPFQTALSDLLVEGFSLYKRTTMTFMAVLDLKTKIKMNAASGKTG
jgi:hypothetical protein